MRVVPVENTGASPGNVPAIQPEIPGDTSVASHVTASATAPR